jgi:hypothetical protein
MRQMLGGRIMPCNCDQLDEDLIEAGYTCYNCYAYRKDNPEYGGI